MPLFERTGFLGSTWQKLSVDTEGSRGITGNCDGIYKEEDVFGCNVALAKQISVMKIDSDEAEGGKRLNVVDGLLY